MSEDDELDKMSATLMMMRRMMRNYIFKMRVMMMMRGARLDDGLQLTTMPSSLSHCCCLEKDG